jgi:hypothetical protein
MEDNTNRFPGAPKYGGWIVDNCPIQRELWLALLDKGIIPDLVIYLSDAENDGKYLSCKFDSGNFIAENILG